LPNLLKVLPPVFANPLYGLIRGVITAGSIGGLDDMRNMAGGIGRAFAGLKMNRTGLRRATDNLRQAFPDNSDDWHRQRAIDCYEHLMMLGIEMMYTGRLVNTQDWPRHILLRGIEPIIRGMGTQRPIIFISGHCGNWEICGYSLALLGLKLHALYRPLDLAPLDNWLRRSRARSGLELVDKFGASSELPAIMAAGHPLGFVADQNAGSKGLFVPFFGRLASTYKAIGLLAVQFQAQVIIGAAHRKLLDPAREPDTLGYSMEAVDSFGPEAYMNQPDPVFYITARYRKGIENTIAAHPEQSLWMHRYWKSRPRWELQGKPIPAAQMRKIEQLPWITASELERLKQTHGT